MICENILLLQTHFIMSNDLLNIKAMETHCLRCNKNNANKNLKN